MAQGVGDAHLGRRRNGLAFQYGQYAFLYWRWNPLEQVEKPIFASIPHGFYVFPGHAQRVEVVGRERAQRRFYHLLNDHLLFALYHPHNLNFLRFGMHLDPAATDPLIGLVVFAYVNDHQRGARLNQYGASGALEVEHVKALVFLVFKLGIGLGGVGQELEELGFDLLANFRFKGLAQTMKQIAIESKRSTEKHGLPPSTIAAQAYGARLR